MAVATCIAIVGSIFRNVAEYRIVNNPFLVGVDDLSRPRGHGPYRVEGVVHQLHLVRLDFCRHGCWWSFVHEEVILMEGEDERQGTEPILVGSDTPVRIGVASDLKLGIWGKEAKPGAASPRTDATCRNSICSVICYRAVWGDKASLKVPDR